MDNFNSVDFDGDPSSGFSNSQTINLSSNIYNSSMSDPSNVPHSVTFPSYSFNTQAAASAAQYPSPTPAPPTPANASIFSYATNNTVTKSVMADMGEIILVFATSAGLSYYMGDSQDMALKRGGIMAVAQFLGGAISYGTLNLGDVNLSIVGDISKFFYSSVLFMAGNKFILESEQDKQVLLRESLLAAIVAHYGSRYVQSYVDKTESVVSQYTSMY